MLPQGGVVVPFYNHPLLSGELSPLWGLGGSRAPPVRGGSPLGDYGGVFLSTSISILQAKKREGSVRFLLDTIGQIRVLKQTTEANFGEYSIFNG